ncbi:MAG: NADH-quinone oxidoreductase subunit N [Candidatus Omnitrophota bacterium]
MPGNNIFSLLPLAILGVAAIGLMVWITFKRTYFPIVLFTGGSLVLALISLIGITGTSWTGELITVDMYAILCQSFLFLFGLAVVAFAFGYFGTETGEKEEFYVLLLLSLLGASVLTVSTHFISFFLGLEILSVSLYAMIAYNPAKLLRLEAGVKYLILASVATAFILFGMALVYGDSGSMSFMELSRIYASDGNANLWFLAGLALIILGVGFKLALVPFHMWAPDIYQGAPSPVTAFVTTVSKGAVVILLVRLLTWAAPADHPGMKFMLSLLAAASMLVGNLLALLQNHVKRLLAYSSIGHLGYLMVPMVIFHPIGYTAVIFYLLAYIITIMGAFGVVILLSSSGGKEADELEDFRGLAYRHPWLTAAFVIFLFSLAGFPFTFGFMAKIYLISIGIQRNLWVLLAALIIGSIIGLFYYLRVVYILLTRTRDGEIEPVSFASPGMFAIGVLTILLVAMGIYPQPLFELIHTAVSALK